VLDDLIGRTLGASTGDVGRAGALPDGDRVLAHVLEPDVADGARALAVDTLVLISTDHDVAGGCMRKYKIYARRVDIKQLTREWRRTRG
jgi:hypothetical protein